MNNNLHYFCSKYHGFTLIEIVIVLILLGILSTSVIQKFTGSSSYEAYTFRSSLISALRLTQQRAMQQTNLHNGFCHQIIIENKQYGVPDRTNCAITSFPVGWQPDYSGLVVDNRYHVTFAIVGGGKVISFDSMGRPKISSSCGGGCDINITSTVETLKIRIESEGYIHAL